MKRLQSSARWSFWQRNMKSRNRIICLLLLLMIILSVAFLDEIMQFGGRMHTRYFVRCMGSGLNMGNTLDATDLRKYRPDADELEYEIWWGNPRLSRETFKTIAEAGFHTVRIPVTWEEHMDEEGIISERWMERVQEVVDMALSEELYVIINMHHEEWLDLQAEKETEILQKFAAVWNQVAEKFQGYDEKLLFESMNEPRLRDSEYEWTSGTQRMRDMVNRLNELFVKTVRETGGENVKRYLMICPYASTSEKEGMQGVTIPDDTRIIISVHMYKPYSFCQEEDGDLKWDTPENRERIAAAFSDMNEIFGKRGIPVILTEFGCVDKGNLEERLAWTKYYMEQAKEYNINCIWWDCGDYRLLDRENGVWRFPEIVKILVGQ